MVLRPHWLLVNIHSICKKSSSQHLPYSSSKTQAQPLCKKEKLQMQKFMAKNIQCSTCIILLMWACNMTVCWTSTVRIILTHWAEVKYGCKLRITLVSSLKLHFPVSAGGLSFSAIAPWLGHLAFDGRILHVKVEHFSYKQCGDYHSVKAPVVVLV